MRVLLISPYSAGLFRWMPLGLPFMAACLRRRGHTPLIFDRYARQAAQGYSLPVANVAMVECIRKFRPDLIGLSTVSQVIYDTAECAALVRSVYAGPLIAGGYHATALPELTLQKIPELDGVVTGEGEVVLSQLADGTPPADLPGVWWRTGQTICPPAAPAEQIAPLDDLPLPAYDLMDMGFYAGRTQHSIRGHHLATITLITSRGCYQRCRFCAESLTYGSGVRFHSPAYVLDWIQRAVADYDVEGLHFHDNDFLASESRAREICEGMLRAGWQRKVKWSIQARADRLNPDIAALLKAAGCVLVEIGIETATQAGLNQIGKGTTLEMNSEAVALCHAVGLAVHAYMLTGLENETLADLDRRLAWVKRARPDSFQWSSLAVYPGTPLYQAKGGNFFAQSAWTKTAVDDYYAADVLSTIPPGQRRTWMARHLNRYLVWLNWQRKLRALPLPRFLALVCRRLIEIAILKIRLAFHPSGA
jgi:anaerobic magnesium-protoporphyrin IX monomethyl ester cyclase